MNISSNLPGSQYRRKHQVEAIWALHLRVGGQHCHQTCTFNRSEIIKYEILTNL